MLEGVASWLAVIEGLRDCVTEVVNSCVAERLGDREGLGVEAGEPVAVADALLVELGVAACVKVTVELWVGATEDVDDDEQETVPLVEEELVRLALCDTDDVSAPE